tara:strand:- start:135 stop:407 length:273 start_codon:yes stop_codon:yes gene_type:complete
MMSAFLDFDPDSNFEIPHHIIPLPIVKRQIEHGVFIPVHLLLSFQHRFKKSVRRTNKKPSDLWIIHEKGERSFISCPGIGLPVYGKSKKN